MIPPRVRVLDMDDLDALPSPCRGCMFWQSAAAPPGEQASDPQGQDAWWQAMQLDWGTPGKGIWDGDELIAFALFAPPLHVQRPRTLTFAPSDDALVLATMWCDPDHRGAGHARHLLQALARDALSQGYEAIEAYGAAFVRDGACVLSGSALEALGFALHRPHPTTALYRMDLDRTVSWPQAVGHALGEVISSLQGRERARARPALEQRQLREDVRTNGSSS
ncbi:GNAT family N-acetyltransferase [Euzebya rosea]|uniref:GNAT family N-acetyltransferase n=1 Tax=Euzebya rosea TaxID=2052804 RepID=UPI00130039F4|nr:GNAT family N-acetyltransferase [Euzebya rosea]